MLHLGELGKNLHLIWANPAFWAAGVVVLVYAFLRFNERPTGSAAQYYEDTDPAAPSRAFTTAFRYRSLQFLYVGIYALAYAAIVIIASVPALREIASEMLKVVDFKLPDGPQTGVTITTWAATLLSVLLPQAPLLKSIDNATRSTLHRAAAIPFKAQELSLQMQEGPFSFVRNDVFRELGRNYHSPEVLDAALKTPDSPLYNFVRLQYLQLAMKKLADRELKFRAFLNGHRENIDPIFSRLDHLSEHVIEGPLASKFDPYSGRAVQNKEFDASIDKLVRNSLDDAYARLTRFLACALLQSSITEESAYDHIEWLGFARPRVESRIDVLTLVYAYLITFAVTTATSSAVGAVLRKFCGPDRLVLGSPCSLQGADMSFDRFVIWGVWAGTIHTFAILCALIVRFMWGLHGASRWRQASVNENRMLSYIVIAIVSWGGCNLIAYAVGYLEQKIGGTQGETAVDLDTLWIWGFVYATTGVCFAALADWRNNFSTRRYVDATIQGVATTSVASLAAYWVLDRSVTGLYAGFPSVAVWLLTVSLTAVIGVCLGLLPSRYRLKTAPYRCRVAVVGAGIAGLSCAESLRHHGYNVTVFEKHLGAGGRVGSWQLDGLPFDLGAPYCATSTSAFEHEVDELVRDGHAAEWEGRHVSLRSGITENALDQSRRIVALPTMNAISRRYAEHIGVQCETEISSVRKARKGRWELITRNGMAIDTYDMVIAAVPAPEAAAIFSNTGASFLGALASVRMTPRIVVAVAFDQRLALDFDSAHVRKGDDDSKSPLRWIARDSSKPGRPDGERWVLHADDDWSAEHAGLSDAELREPLLEEFWRITGHGPMKPILHKVVRWKYAAVQRALRDAPPFDPDLRLGACGDWCSGGSMEAAWINGRKMVGEINVSWTVRRLRNLLRRGKGMASGQADPAGNLPALSR